ncbi:MAG: hypothetical protein K2X48_14300 [Chitinophagaceae bacterium]|nr:hypothetical protein [Chitinophagaceae bacterium]
MEPIYYYLFGGTIIVFVILGWYLRKKGREELKQQIAAQEQVQFTNLTPVQREKPQPQPSSNPEMLRLQLQAYERLAILTERLGLQNLISRFNANSLTASQMQQQLIQTIRSEFEYNVSQQLYVSFSAWDAVKNLKEQNIYIINQVAALLPPGSTGLDLSKSIAELLAADENASLQPIVAALLQKEAKQLMQG